MQATEIYCIVVSLKRKALIIIYTLITVIISLLIISQFRWELSRPIFEYISYDYFIFYRYEKDRWADVTWKRYYFPIAFLEYPDEDTVEKVIEYFNDYNVGVASRHILKNPEYETIRAKLLPFVRCPIFWQEAVDGKNSEVTLEKKKNRVLLTALWDISFLSCLIGLGLHIYFYIRLKTLYDLITIIREKQIDT